MSTERIEVPQSDLSSSGPSISPERSAVEHELKCWPEYFGAVLSGAKPFEVRKDDRDYRTGDTLWLREWDCDMPGRGNYLTGRQCRRRVTFIMRHPPFVPDGFCIMGLASVPPGPAAPPPEQWACQFCGGAELVNGQPERAARRKAEHEAQCPSNPDGPGHPLHGYIRPAPPPEPLRALVEDWELDALSTALANPHYSLARSRSAKELRAALLAGPAAPQTAAPPEKTEDESLQQ